MNYRVLCAALGAVISYYGVVSDQSFFLGYGSACIGFAAAEWLFPDGKKVRS